MAAADGSSTITAADAGGGAAPLDLDAATNRAFAMATKALEEHQTKLKALAPKLEERAGAMQSLVDSMPVKVDAAVPQGPKTTSAPHTPEPDPIQSFGSFASVLGIIGSMALKQPISTALNASAAAMKARSAQDWAQYEAHYREWKDQTDLALKQADFEQKHFDDIINLAKTNQNLALSKVGALATLTQNDGLRVAAESGDFAQIGQYFASVSRLNTATKAAQVRLEELHDRDAHMRAMEDIMRRRLAKPSAAEAKKADVTNTLESLDSQVEGLLADLKADPGLTGLSAHRREIIQKGVGTLQQLDPTGAVGGVDRAVSKFLGTTPEDRAKKAQAAVDFSTRLEALKDTLAQPIMKAKYFSGPIAGRLDELVKGEGLFDDPKTTEANLSALQKLIKDQIGYVRKNPAEADQSTLSDVMLMQQLRQSLERDLGPQEQPDASDQ